MSATRSPHSVQELRQLIAMLERSGMAEQRPEARALLERSRALLRRHQRRPRRVVGKLGTLLAVLLDAAMLAALPFLVIHLLTEPPGWAAWALGAAPPLWLIFRLRRRLGGVGEAGRRALYHLAWGWDWFAEAFSVRAMDRLEARLGAREVMWGWNQHRRALPHRPSLADVEGFLAVEYGAAAALGFRRAAEALGATRQGGQRLAALRWSALITLFGELAAKGALWPVGLGLAPASPAEDAVAVHLAAPPSEPADAPERAVRRADLRDLIRRKRQDITAAFGWQLKTEAQIAQRDQFLALTRAEIAAAERELTALGG